MAACRLASELRRDGRWSRLAEGTQASVGSNFGAEGSICRSDTVSARAVVCSDRRIPSNDLRKLACVVDMLLNLQGLLPVASTVGTKR